MLNVILLETIQKTRRIALEGDPHTKSSKIERQWKNTKFRTCQCRQKELRLAVFVQEMLLGLQRRMALWRGHSDGRWQWSSAVKYSKKERAQFWVGTKLRVIAGRNGEWCLCPPRWQISECTPLEKAGNALEGRGFISWWQLPGRKLEELNWCIWHPVLMLVDFTGCILTGRVRFLPALCTSCLGFFCPRGNVDNLTSCVAYLWPVGYRSLKHTVPFSLPGHDSLRCSLCISMHLEMASCAALPPAFLELRSLIKNTFLCLMMMSYLLFFWFPGISSLIHVLFKKCIT